MSFIPETVLIAIYEINNNGETAVLPCIVMTSQYSPLYPSLLPRYYSSRRKAFPFQPSQISIQALLYSATQRQIFFKIDINMTSMEYPHIIKHIAAEARRHLHTFVVPRFEYLQHLLRDGAQSNTKIILESQQHAEDVQEVDESQHVGEADAAGEIEIGIAMEQDIEEHHDTIAEHVTHHDNEEWKSTLAASEDRWQNEVAGLRARVENNERELRDYHTII